MTGDDIDRAAADFDLHMRAGALCSVAEPHRDADEDWPCSGCLLRAASQRSIPSTDVSTPASALSSETPRPLAEGVDGAVGRDRRLAAAPPRFDEDGEWDANGWERLPTWQRRPRS